MDSANTVPRPPYDPLMVDLVREVPPEIPPGMTAEDIVNVLRKDPLLVQGPNPKDLHADPELVVTRKIIRGPHGDIQLEVVRKQGGSSTIATRPGIVFLHGGGMVLGDVFLGSKTEWVKELDAVMIAVDYRLAPEFKDKVLVEDCYAALAWVGENLDELGIDPDRLALAGFSAGGGLAASTALMARDRGGPRLCAQLLMLPMLDDRNDTVSSKQFWSHGTFTGGLNALSWSCVLGDRVGRDDVSHYVVAGRATARDLVNLPEAYIEVGANEPFRDDAVAYASKLWEAGSQAELHVWPGGPHCFEIYRPEADVSKSANKTRMAWMAKVLRKSK